MDKSNRDLRSAYVDLLKERGLDQLTRSRSALDEGREALANAGWLEGLGDLGDAIQQKMVTLSDNPVEMFNSILADIKNEVECSIQQRGASSPKNVFVGCLPLEEINAEVRPVPEGFLVLVNTALMQSIYQIGKVFLLSYDWLRAGVDDKGVIALFCDEGTEKEIETFAETVEWESSGWTKRGSVMAITAILDAIRYHGSPSFSPRQRVAVGEKAITLGSIVAHAEFFVIAHEYAHLLLSHSSLGELHETLGSLPEARKASRDQEFEADQLAASILLASGDWNSPNGEFDVNARGAGIALAFVAQAFHALAYHGPASFSPEINEVDDHPGSVSRIIRIVEWLHGKYGKSVSGLARVLAGWQVLISPEVASALDDLSTAESLEKQAQSHFEQKNYADAGTAFRKVVELRNSALGEYSLSLATPLSNLANCLDAGGEKGEAEAAFLRSLAICEEVGSVAGTHLPQVLENIALHYVMTDDREDVVKPYFIRSADEWEKQGVEHTDSFLHCCWEYLNWLLSHHLDDDAIALGNRVVKVLEDWYGEKHPRVVETVEFNAKLRKMLRTRK